MNLNTYQVSEFPEIRRLLLRCWVADTFSVEALIMKIAADREFQDLTHTIRTINRHHFIIHEEEVQRFQPVVRWMYKETQRHLHDTGFHHQKTLFRGVNEENATIQPLMSYSERRDIAKKYAGMGSQEQDGVVLKLPVPAKRIFMYFGGPGWEHSHFDDLEYIIICDRHWEQKQ